MICVKVVLHYVEDSYDRNLLYFQPKSTDFDQTKPRLF